MKTKSLLTMATGSILKNKMRTMLTMLGIVSIVRILFLRMLPVAMSRSALVFMLPPSLHRCPQHRARCPSSVHRPPRGAVPLRRDPS